MFELSLKSAVTRKREACTFQVQERRGKRLLPAGWRGWQLWSEPSLQLKALIALAGVAQSAGYYPTHRKVASSIPGSGLMPEASGLFPSGGRAGGGQLMFLSPSLLPPFPLFEIKVLIISVCIPFIEDEYFLHHYKHFVY